MKTKSQMLLIIAAIFAWAHSAGAQFAYTITGGTITITGYNGSGGAVVIPGAINGTSVTGIGDEAFFNNPGITSVNIPSSVTGIGVEAFSVCSSLTNIMVDAANPVYSSLSGVLFDEAQGTLIQYPGGLGGSYTVPESVINIGDFAFYDTGLTNVTILYGVTSIGDEAFSFAVLPSVDIPDSVTNIGEGAFYGSYLTSVDIPESVLSIGAQGFQNCTSLTSINVDPANPAYSSLSGVLFDEAQVTLIQYPAGLGGSYTIPGSVTSIGFGAFSWCSSLTSVDIPDGVTNIGDEAFYVTGIITVDIPDSVTSIGIDGFCYCTSLTSVTIPDSVTSIGIYAFEQCYNLPTVDIPGSVANIGAGVFYECLSLTDVTIPDSVTNIGEYAFEYCSSLASVTIPSSVTSIGDDAFDNCTNLTSAYILGNAPPDDGTVFTSASGSDPATVYYLISATGWGSTFGGVPTVMWNPFTYTTANGVITITGYDTSAGLNMVIPAAINGDPVTSIGAEAFDTYISLTSVHIPNSVTNIGDEAFYECLSLTNVNIPNGVTSIGDNAFFFCDSLTSVTIPASVTTIADYAFFNCTSLASAYFLGNAPPDDGTIFTSYAGTDPATVYYLAGTTGWGPRFGSVPALLWNPQATAFTVGDGQFGFSISGPPNAVIVVDACSDLANPVWVPVSTITLSSGGTALFTDGQAGNYPNRYYRLSSQ